MGFDTNVLVRYFVKEDPRLAATVGRLNAEAAAAEVTLVASTVVLCETVSVLDAREEIPKAGIAGAIEKLLLTLHFEFKHHDHVWQALRRFRDGHGDFADYLIGARNAAGGCDRTFTFDRALEGEEGFEVLP